jgi:DMSO/TMAO reductase YedYZ molybdopterin-dependent catalytic subunit
MRKSMPGWGFLLGALLAAPLTVLMYLGKQLFDLNFPPYDLFNWATRLLPGPVVTFGIDALIAVLHFLGVDVAQTAKFAEQIMAVSGFLLLAVILGAVYIVIISRQVDNQKISSGLLAGALFSLPIIAISTSEGNSSLPPVINILWLLVLFATWGITLAWSAKKLLSIPQTLPSEATQERKVQRISRREFLITLGAASASITVVGSGVAAFLSRGEDQGLQDAIEDEMPMGNTDQQIRQLPNDNNPITPAPGTRPEYTPLEDHYTVNIQLEPTVIDGDTWQLPITGMVDNPLMLSLDDIRNKYPSREQYTTLNCISGRIPTTLISTTLWTGVSLQDILADARVQPDAKYLQIMSGDGFYESVSLNMINSDERIMLCYAFDGKPLPIKNGFPLRIWIPDYFGMKQPKWITSIEVTDEYKEGYWVQRGWDEVARIRTRSEIDTVAVDAIYEEEGQMMVPIGGIAFAGMRGISKVEVNTGGVDWVEAQLRSPLSDTTWVIWRYNWHFEEGKHIFKVRCYEGDGTMQITENAPPHPSGATGIHIVQKEL